MRESIVGNELDADMADAARVKASGGQSCRLLACVACHSFEVVLSRRIR